MLSGDAAHHVAGLCTTVYSGTVSEGVRPAAGPKSGFGNASSGDVRLVTLSHRGHATVGNSTMDQGQRNLAWLDPVICTTICSDTGTCEVAAG